MCAHFQAYLKEFHLLVVKRIFKYMNDKQNIGLFFFPKVLNLIWLNTQMQIMLDAILMIERSPVVHVNFLDPH